MFQCYDDIDHIRIDYFSRPMWRELELRIWDTHLTKLPRPIQQSLVMRLDFVCKWGWKYQPLFYRHESWIQRRLHIWLRWGNVANKRYFGNMKYVKCEFTSDFDGLHVYDERIQNKHLYSVPLEDTLVYCCIRSYLISHLLYTFCYILHKQMFWRGYFTRCMCMC